MIDVTAKIRGTRPMLMDPMAKDKLEEIRTKNYKDVPLDRPIEDVAAEKVIRENDDKEGRIGIPSTMLFACLVNAGRNIKVGKNQLSTAKTTQIPHFLQIADLFLPFTNLNGGKEQSWGIDRRKGKNDKGQALCIVRPRFEEWEFTVHLNYDERKIDGSVLISLFQNAGSTQGLGGFRPNCKGPFGTFELIGWVEKKVKTEDKEINIVMAT